MKLGRAGVGAGFAVVRVDGGGVEGALGLACRPASSVGFGPFEAAEKFGAGVPVRVMPAAAESTCVSLLIDVRGPVGRPASVPG